MLIHEVLDFRKAEDEKQKYLKDQTRIMYGSLTVYGTGNANVDIPGIDFGFMKFMEEPNLVGGNYKLEKGTITTVDLGVLSYARDTKQLVDKAALRITVQATGAWTIEVYFQFQAQCHMVYETGAEWE